MQPTGPEDVRLEGVAEHRSDLGPALVFAGGLLIFAVLLTMVGYYLPTAFEQI